MASFFKIILAMFLIILYVRVKPRLERDRLGSTGVDRMLQTVASL
jgi:hypothetical protein